MKLEIPRVFSAQQFPPTSDSLSPFGVSHSRGNAVKSLVRKRNEAEERQQLFLLSSTLYFPLFLSTLVKSQRTMQSFAILLIAKFHRFRPFRRIFKKIALPATGHGLCRREIRSTHFVRELPAKEGCKTSKIHF